MDKIKPFKKVNAYTTQGLIEGLIPELRLSLAAGTVLGYLSLSMVTTLC